MKKIFTLVFLSFILQNIAKSDSIYVQSENDVYTRNLIKDNISDDRHYTNGSKFGYIDTNVQKSKFEKFDFFVNYNIDVSYSFAQLMYTPSDIKTSEFQENDRPYAGWLYGEYGRFYSNKKEQKFIVLQLGIIGPAALGEEIQTGFHRMIGDQLPNGWEHQLENEPGFNLIYQSKNRLFSLGDVFDFTSHYGGSIGNVMTFINTGAEFRLGFDLPSDFKVNRIEPTPKAFNSNHNFLDYLKLNESYLFFNFDGRVMIRNIFLDGNTFVDSHSVNKNNLVGDLEFGSSISIWKFNLISSIIFRSKEFSSQEDFNTFGSLKLNYSF